MNIKSQKHVTKSSLFPMNFDSSTTINIGEIIPTSILELTPKSSVEAHIGSAARLAPMVNPTFGKCNIYDYVFNCKLSRIYPFYNNILSSQPVVGNDGSNFIPTAVPSTSLSNLLLNVLLYSSFSVSLVGTMVGPDMTYSEAVVPLSLTSFAQIYGASANLGTTGFELGMPFTLARSFKLASPNVPSSVFSSIFPTRIQTGLYFSPAYGCASPDPTPSNSPISEINPENSDFAYYFDKLYAVQSNGSYVEVNPMTSGVSDYVSKYYGPGYSFTASKFLVAFNLNYQGKLINKILTGLGYRPSLSSKPVSVLPILAYYKCWFDLFNPKRNVTWEQSLVYRYFDYISRTVPEPLCTVQSDISNWVDSVRELSFPFVLYNLLGCYYSTPHNYVTLPRDVNDVNANIRFNTLEDASIDGVNDSVIYVNGDATGNGRVVIDNPDSGVSSTDITMVQRFAQFINSKRFVPQSIKDYLMNKFGIDVPSDTYLVGVNRSDLSFDDVFQTATTSEGYLGEYAGRSVGSGSKNMRVNTDEYSYLIVLSCVVPRTQYVQGVNPLLNHVSTLDFYREDFDGVTMQNVPVSEIFNPCEVANLSVYNQTNFSEQSFGVNPIYTDYKVAPCGILGGDLSLRSTRNSFVGFTLDSLIGQDDISYNVIQTEAGASDFYQVVNTIPVYTGPKITPSQAWRFISPVNGRSNLQRIFVNGTVEEPVNYSGKFMFDDTIVLHHVFDFKIHSYMLPISHSYQTFDLCEMETNAARSTSIS